MVQASTNLAMEEQPQYIQRKAGKSVSPSGANRAKSTSGGHEVYRKGDQQLELLISDKTVEKIMGPEPFPSLDIEIPLIANEL